MPGNLKLKKVRLTLGHCPGSVFDPLASEAIELLDYAETLPGTPVAPSIEGMDAALLETIQLVKMERSLINFHAQQEAAKNG